jgi:hypothetical protein
MVYLLAKRARYLYDADAIREGGEPVPQRVKVPGGWDVTKGEGGHGTVHRQGRSAATYRERNVGGRTDRFTRMPGGEVEWGENGRTGRNKRSVWSIATQPYPEAHFATFPEALVEPCVLAGTSEKGACPECGAPWERVTEREATGFDGSRYGERAVAATGGAISGGTNASTLGSSNGRGTASYATTGWRPGCDHGLEPVPCVVLDPFGGSGTVAMVANRLGRKAVHVDLSEEYIAQAIKRIGESRATGDGPAIDMPVPLASDGLWAELG